MDIEHLPSHCPAAVGNPYEIPTGLACPDQGGHQASAVAGCTVPLTRPFHGWRNAVERNGTFHFLKPRKRRQGAAFQPFRSTAQRTFWNGVERHGTAKPPDSSPTQ